LDSKGTPPRGVPDMPKIAMPSVRILARGPDGAQTSAQCTESVAREAVAFGGNHGSETAGGAISQGRGVAQHSHAFG